MKIVIEDKLKEGAWKSPRSLLIYALPKTGKSTICAKLGYMVSLESGGVNYLDSYRGYDIPGELKKEGIKPSDFNTLVRYNELMDELEKQGVPTGILIIDTLSRLDQLSELAGTLRYMKRKQGKSFNRDAQGKVIDIDSPAFESVLELGKGFGYKYSRDWMLEQVNRACEMAEYVIFLCHVKDKFLESKSGDTVQSLDIDLTGKLKSIVTAKVDAIGYFYVDQKSGEGILSFKNKDDKMCGARPKSTIDDIVISRDTKNGVETYWDKIYVD